jgi:hypothetical protein
LTSLTEASLMKSSTADPVLAGGTGRLVFEVTGGMIASPLRTSSGTR